MEKNKKSWKRMKKLEGKSSDFLKGNSGQTLRMLYKKDYTFPFLLKYARRQGAGVR
jgi:hypothetical protein